MTGSANTPRLVGSGRVKGMAQLHQALPLIERQHALIEELRARAPRHVPGAELARRTGTTVRTVERDIARLQDAGVPLHVKRGPGGGYRIDARRVLPPVTLTPGEASALVASLVAVGPYTSATAQSALAKLLASLVEPSRTCCISLEQRCNRTRADPTHRALGGSAADGALPDDQPVADDPVHRGERVAGGHAAAQQFHRVFGDG